MVVTHDTPTRLVLEMDKSQPQFKPLTWRGCIGPSLGVILVFILIFALVWASFSFSYNSLSWLLWPFIISIILVATFLVAGIFISLSNYKHQIKEATVCIDLDSQEAVRIEKCNSGKINHFILNIKEVTQVLIHGDDLGHRLTVTLESYNNPSFSINSEVFYDSKPMIELGKKLGAMIKKPVVFKITDTGKPVSEETLQP
jgi:hypothetical protein